MNLFSGNGINAYIVKTMLEKLIIFDCDGVLVDSEFIMSKIFAETLSTFGYSISVEECIRRFTGKSELICRTQIMEEANINLPLDYWDLQYPLLLKTYETELRPLLQPVLETLDALDIPRCVASNSVREHVIHCLDCTKQMRFFTDSSIFTFQQVSKPKPDPELFLFAAKEMGFTPENCIVIEDSSTGVHAAVAAGMHVLMYLGGSHASFSWYQDQVSIHKKPMLVNCNDLLSAIQTALEAK